MEPSNSFVLYRPISTFNKIRQLRAGSCITQYSFDGIIPKETDQSFETIKMAQAQINGAERI